MALDLESKSVLVAYEEQVNASVVQRLTDVDSAMAKKMSMVVEIPGKVLHQGVMARPTKMHSLMVSSNASIQQDV
jgi:hypothetical protein